MRGKKIGLLALMTIVVSTMLLLPAGSNPVTLVCIDPGISSGMDPFSVDVVVEDVLYLYGYQFELYYDTAVLSTNFAGLHVGDFFPGYDIWDFWVDDSAGLVRLAITLPAGTPPPGESGSGTLATIDFTVDAAGSSGLDLAGTILTDGRTALPITHSTCDGLYTTTLAESYGVSIVTAWVEDANWQLSKDADGAFTLSAHIKNMGGATVARCVFTIMDENLAPVDTLVTDGVTVQPKDMPILEADWWGYMLPGKYHVEIGVEYLDETGAWVGGLKGSPQGSRDVMAKHFTTEA